MEALELRQPAGEVREHLRIADGIVDLLEQRGITAVFGVPGGTISPIFDALVDSAIEVVTCQHEQMAVYLAYGYARATGQCGVVLATSGPGVLNTLTAVAAAYQDEVPVLVLAGEVDRSSAWRGTLQDGTAGGLDVLSIVRPITKLVDSLQQPQRARAVVAQAIDECLSVPQGPALLTLPIDVTREAMPSYPVVQAVRGAPRPDPHVLRRIATRIAEAWRPVLVAGVGARTGEAGAALLRLAEWFRCPVITDIEARGVLPESHPLHLGSFGVGGSGPAAGWLSRADVVVTIGCRLDDTTTSGFSALFDEAWVAQLDHDPRRLGRAYAPDLAMYCDLREALQGMAGVELDPLALALRDARVRDARQSSRPDLLPAMGHAPFHPASVVRALQAAFGKQSVFVSDIGNHMLFAARELEVEHPHGLLVSNGLGGMGSGIGVAMGYAAARQRRVVAICGDGSARMVGNEIATCVANRVPVVLAIFDDQQLGMVEHGNQQVFGRSQACDSPATDFVRWAQSFGCAAVRVDSEADIHAAVAHVDGPLVLHVPIDSSVRARSPRADSFSEREAS